MSDRSPIARYCMPQKQTHQIAMTALHGVAPISGGFGPDRIGRRPSFALASSSASTSSTKASTSANASHGPGDVLGGRTAAPMFGSRCCCKGDQIGWSLLQAPHAIQSIVAIDVAPTDSRSLQTDSKSQPACRRWTAARCRNACVLTHLVTAQRIEADRAVLLGHSLDHLKHRHGICRANGRP
jgi:hypothetical protein